MRLPKRLRINRQPSLFSARSAYTHDHVRAGLPRMERDHGRMLLPLKRRAIFVNSPPLRSDGCSPHHLFCSQAQNLFRTGVTRNDPSLRILQHDAFRQRRDDAPISLSRFNQRRFGASRFGDIFGHIGIPVPLARPCTDPTDRDGQIPLCARGWI